MKPSQTLNTHRMKTHFLDLVQIDSISKKERAVALVLEKALLEIGASVSFDQAGETVGD